MIFRFMTFARNMLQFIKAVVEKSKSETFKHDLRNFFTTTALDFVFYSNKGENVGY